MILLDYSNIAMAAMTAVWRPSDPIERMNLKYTIINSIRNNNKKFRKEYGELILCCDHSSPSWRREAFPQYKQKRREGRENSSFDWKKFFSILDETKVDLREIFGYRVISVSGAEADDIIAVLSRNGAKNLIIGNDKDFVQLLNEENVHMFSPRQKAMVAIPEDARWHTRYQVLTGDKDDGVPNVLSDDDCLVAAGKRQKALSQKKILELINYNWDTADMPDELRRNIKRNEMLIDLSKIPQTIEDSILAESNSQERIIDASKITNYLIENKYQSLYEKIGDFK
jgi:5'-3' exonuclease